PDELKDSRRRRKRGNRTTRRINHHCDCQGPKDNAIGHPGRSVRLLPPFEILLGKAPHLELKFLHVFDSRSLRQIVGSVRHSTAELQGFFESWRQDARYLRATGAKTQCTADEL